MLFNGFPLYEASIKNEVDGIVAISLVDYPAVESNFVAFKKTPGKFKFSVDDEDKHLISGVIMLADTPIYRNDNGYEYYIVYSKETIRVMASKMLEDGTFKRIDIQHDGEMIEGLEMVEVFIKDDSKGISPNYVEEVPDGSLFATFHVTDDALWEEVKNGNLLNGFSLEGFFTVQKMNNQKSNNMHMNKIAKFVKSLMKFGEADSDKGKIYYDGDSLVIGAEVYVDGEGDEKVLASDGEYVVEDKIIVVADGKVSEIKDKEEEVEEVEVVEEFKAKRQKFEESYDEKTRKIAEAIHLMGFDGWIREAGDDFAILEIWVEDTQVYKDYRFGLTWDAEGNPVIGDYEEVKEAFVPVDNDVEVVEEKPVEMAEDEIVEEPADDNRIVILEDKVKNLETALGDLRAAVDKLLGAPAADTIVEEFEKATETPRTKQGKAARLLAYAKN